MSTTGIPELTLSPKDIPGAVLSKPCARHTAAALCWWLLCQGVKVPSSLKKQLLLDRYVYTTKINLQYIHGKTTAICPAELMKQKRENRPRPIVDVDGSYIYRKYKSLTESGVQVELPLNPPSTSLWLESCKTKQFSVNCFIHSSSYLRFAKLSMISSNVQVVSISTGLLYTYLAGHVGRNGSEGAFRALSCGYMHWASGRLEELKVNSNHPEYCHIQYVP